MNESTKIAITRCACGTALLITHAVTGFNHALVLIGVALLGVPIELVK